ncbi:MAG: hypothetical protein RJQ10_08400 [Haliea sp.]|uniref:hypothetical protein n=1 Tax=Haliea sp. TaxID=1932666 RepID=UPI0032EF9133
MFTKQTPAIALVTVSLAAAASGSVAQEADASLETCRQLQQKIERLDARRKGGGSAQKMDQWKRQRQVYKDQFADLKCRHWRNRLR